MPVTISFVYAVEILFKTFRIDNAYTGYLAYTEDIRKTCGKIRRKDGHTQQITQ